MTFHGVVEVIARTLELTGVAVVALGILAATAHFATRVVRSGLPASEFAGYRERLARATLLGL